MRENCLLLLFLRFYLAITLLFTVKTLKSKQLLFWDITQHTTSRFKDLPPTGALQRQPLFERAFLLVAKQSNTVNFPALEKGLSLVPSQDSISCLELVTVRRGKTEENLVKRCPTVRSHSAAEPEEAVNQCVRSNATAFGILPFKTVRRQWRCAETSPRCFRFHDQTQHYTPDTELHRHRQDIIAVYIIVASSLYQKPGQWNLGQFYPMCKTLKNLKSKVLNFLFIQTYAENFNLPTKPLLSWKPLFFASCRSKRFGPRLPPEQRQQSPDYYLVSLSN